MNVSLRESLAKTIAVNPRSRSRFALLWVSGAAGGREARGEWGSFVRR